MSRGLIARVCDRTRGQTNEQQETVMQVMEVCVVCTDETYQGWVRFGHSAREFAPI